MHFITDFGVPFVFVLGLLIFIHELGHFILAKAVGIRVERFSMGFPPRLFGKKIGDTDYCISALPLGGYVKMAGMIDESLEKDSIKGEPWEFMSKPLWARVLVIAAGPTMNILLAVAIFSTIFYVKGVTKSDNSPYIGTVWNGYPAQEAGIVAGDRIASIDDQPVNSWNDIVTIIHSKPEQKVKIAWQRGDSLLSADLTPKRSPDAAVGLIGIEPRYTQHQYGILASIGNGFSYSWGLTKLIGVSLKKIFSGQASIKESLVGPIGILKMVGEASREGFLNLLGFAAFLSLNLGLLNILPIPVLDGGHLVFMAIEAIIRRPLSVKVRLITQQVGMALLLALMVYVIFNDVTRLF